MPDAPFISGSEILANPGNAALGYSSGVDYDFNPADTNPFAGVQGTLSRIQEEEKQMRFQRHLEKQKEQEQLAETISSLKGKGSVFNLKGPDGANTSFTPLPEDEVILTEKADELRKLALKSPGGYKYNREFLKKKDEFDYLTAHAGMRAVHDAQNRQAAVKATDEEDRAGYLKNIDEEVTPYKLTDLYRPKPYNPAMKTEGESILPSKDRLDKDNFFTKSVTVADEGGIGIQTDMTGLRDDIVDVRGKIKPGTKAYSEAVIMSQRFISSPLTQNPKAIEDMNRRIDANNASRGYKPGDAHYQPHVAEVQPDGTVGFVSTDPAQIAGAIFFEQYGGLQASKKPTDILEKKKAAESQIKNQEDDNRRQWATLQDKIRHEKEMEEIARNKGKAKEADELKEINAPVITYLEFAKSAREKKPLPIPDMVGSAMKAQGIDPGQYEYVPLNATDEGVSRIFGISKVDKDGKAQKGLNSPTAAYYLRSKTGDMKDDFIAGTYNEGPTTKWKTVKPNEAVSNIYSNTGNASSFKQINKIQNKLSEYLGGNAPASQAPAAEQKQIVPEKAPSVPQGYTEKTTSKGIVYYESGGRRYVYSGGEMVEIAKPAKGNTALFRGSQVRIRTQPDGKQQFLDGGAWVNIKSIDPKTGEIQVGDL